MIQDSIEVSYGINTSRLVCHFKTTFNYTLLWVKIGKNNLILLSYVGFCSFFFLLKTNIFAESFWLLPLLNRFFCRQKNFIHKLFPAIVVFQRQIRCRKWFAAVSCAIIIIWFDIKIVRNQIIFKFISTSFIQFHFLSQSSIKNRK